MKILVVIDDYFNQSNGLCISTQRFVSEFQQMGHEVRIVSTNSKADYPVKELIVPFFRKIIAKESFHMARPQKKVLLKAISWADLVLIETPFPLSWRAAALAKRHGKPVAGTLHIFPGNITEPLHLNYRFFNSFFMYFFKYVSYRNCQMIFCPSKKLRNLMEQYHFKQPLQVISNGISEAFINNPHKEKIGNPFTIICIGRYSEEKHQATLFRALQHCKHANELRVIFAGKGPLQQEYEKLAAKLSCATELRFFTPEKLRQTLTNCDLVVHCADVEVEGMACMEAFAAGCVPVIADSKLSATADYALGKDNLFPFDDDQALAKKINYWYEHPAELKQMRSDYRNYAKTLTVKASAQKEIRCLKKIAKNV
ncbi:glycosyltransferase [Lactobacillus amylolyticus]|uniref:glycosyltransferase n=1 Tax=Lactobacillus amylolyticus TaxID=83683 RepID=UPI000FCBE66C|nr:glycosyltransferase [Lactobacillus amylolyticus]